MTENEMLEHIYGKVCDVEAKVDNLGDRFDDYRVHVEGRLTRVEVRSTLFGTLGGVVSGFLSSLGLKG